MNYYTTATEFNCGIDLHSTQMYVCVMDREGQTRVHTNIHKNDFTYFLKLVAPYKHSLTVVCESTFNWYWLSDACFDAKLTFVLAHALYLNHIHGGKNKNDRIDAQKLAHLLRANLIPIAYVYPAARRPVRALLRQRMNYVWQRSALMTRVAMNQMAEGHTPAAKSGHNREVWQERVLAQYSHPLHQMAVTSEMEIIKAYDTQVHALEQEITRQAKALDGVNYAFIDSVPGIGPILAMTILFEMDTVSRFESVKNFVSYARLVKGSVASAGKIKGLTGGKMGNPYLRWAFGEAAILCKRHQPLIAIYGDQLIAKHGKFKANAILAAKLARCVYFMLLTGTPFDPAKLIATSL